MPWRRTIFSMLAFVFSCDDDVDGGRKLDVAAHVIAVRVGVDDRRDRLVGVSSLILSRIGWPQPGFFVSTTMTPFVWTNTAVLPPPPFSTNRLSLSFSTSTTFGAAAACGC